jgi:putative SOS response-associated peptidase YedK
MCGRFVCSKAPEVYGAFYDVIAPAIVPNFNVAPTQQVAVVRMRDGQKECVLQRWGLIPSWAKDKKTMFINARAETLLEKPAFRTAVKRRRCLILADGYYEWKTLAKAKQPYYLRPRDDEPIAFAGIWECWNGGAEAEPIESCSIITTEANELSRPIHDRMPVILRAADANAWIDAEVEDPQGIVTLLRPFPSELMTCYAVGPHVSSMKNNGPACIEPAAIQ